MNDSCSLQSPKCNTNSSCNTVVPNQNASQEETGTQKVPVDQCNSDSILSLRNCSGEIHSSTQLLYKTQSPQAVEKVLVRQTSTPMEHFILHSPEEADCFDAAASRISHQYSSIYGSSDSELNSFCSDNCGNGYGTSSINNTRIYFEQKRYYLPVTLSVI